MEHEKKEGEKTPYFTLLVILILGLGTLNVVQAVQIQNISQNLNSNLAINTNSQGTLVGAAVNNLQNPNAKVTIIEFADFECPYCGRADQELKKVKQYYGSNVEIIYQHFPLNFHANAQKAAEAAECARDQEKFQEYHDILYQNQDSLSIPDLKSYATQLNLNPTAFNTCLDLNSKRSEVQRQQQAGASKGVSGTPTFFINGEEVGGAIPFEQFKAIIDKKLSGDNTLPSPAAQIQNTKPTREENIPQGTSPILGNNNAPVTIIEFSDFECPYCGRFYSDAYQQIKKNYIDTGKVKLVFKHNPLPFHQHARIASIAAACAQEQGKFFEYHDLIFENQADLSPENLKVWAKQLNLNEDTFNTCLDTQKTKPIIANDLQLAASLGVSGTPSFFINGILLVGAQPFAAFEQIISQELEN